MGFVLATVGIIGLAELRWVYDCQRSIKTTQRQVQRVRKELRDFDKLGVALSDANVTSLESELSSLRTATAELRRQLMPATKWRDEGADNARASERADGYFEIATFVERTRDRARTAGVLLLPDERFGFSEYAHSGPAVAEQVAVSRQRAIIEVILDALFDAQPRELISVVRESRAVAGADDRKSQSARSSSAEESMFTDVRLSLRRARSLETNGMRFSFTGQTVTLRLFLTSLLRAETPLAVRSVEIEPMTRRSKPGGVAPSETESAPVPPLVEQSLSRFTVTIEAYDFPTNAASSG